MLTSAFIMLNSFLPSPKIIIKFYRQKHLKGQIIYKEERKIAETLILIQFLKFDGYNSKLLGILFNTGDVCVCLCCFSKLSPWYDVFCVFWWTAKVSVGTSVCKLLRDLLWTVSKFPAEGSADEDQNSCPYLQWHLGKVRRYGTVLHTHNCHTHYKLLSNLQFKEVRKRHLISTFQKKLSYCPILLIT